VPVLTALKAMTLWSAYSHGEENDKGSIEAGKLADFVILSDDPTAVDPETIDQIKVTETIKEGETVFRLDAKELKKSELMWPRDRLDTVLDEFLRAAYVSRRLQELPPSERTEQRRAALAEGYDDCAAGLVLADLMGIEARGHPFAAS
jgi:adenine deaminase